jgi:ABC-type sugar transport system permease subunit
VSDTKLLLVTQAIVTFALLGFAYVMRGDAPTISDVIVSAAVYHWLRESASIGRGGAATTIAKAANGNGKPKATVDG